MALGDASAGAVDQSGMPLDAVMRAYRALGVVMLQGFFDAGEVAALAAEADLLLGKYREGRIEARRVALRPAVDGAHIFERFDPVCDIAPACDALARHPDLLALVSGLIGGEPFLFKDKLIYKFPGDAGYGLHQDYPYYDLNEALKDRVVTVAIAIDEASGEAGGLQFYLKRHDRVQPAPPGDPRDCDPAALSDAEKCRVSLPPGGLVAFHTLTPHGSGANKTARMRRMLYLTYIDSKARGLREEYYRTPIAARIAPRS